MVGPEVIDKFMVRYGLYGPCSGLAGGAIVAQADADALARGLRQNRHPAGNGSTQAVIRLGTASRLSVAPSVVPETLAQGTSAMRTMALPKFLPFRRPMKASGAFSNPSVTSSRYFNWPLETQAPIWSWNAWNSVP